VVTDLCLEPDEVIGLLEEGLEYPGGEQLMEHVMNCAYCCRQVADMRETLRFGARAKALQRLIPNSQADTTLTDMERPWLGEGATPWYRRWRIGIADALRTLRNPVPTAVLGFGSATRTSATSAISAPIQLLTPVSTYVPTDQPTLRWHGGAGVETYDVTVMNALNPEDLVESLAVPATEWKVARPLQPGQDYDWWVLAATPDQQFSSSIATFRVLAEEQTEEITTAAEEYADRPLELGILYAQAGLLDAAEAEYLRAGTTEPAPALLEDLRQRRSR
jgi:hypothetical protein